MSELLEAACHASRIVLATDESFEQENDRIALKIASLVIKSALLTRSRESHQGFVALSMMESHGLVWRQSPSIEEN